MLLMPQWKYLGHEDVSIYQHISNVAYQNNGACLCNIWLRVVLCACWRMCGLEFLYGLV